MLYQKLLVGKNPYVIVAGNAGAFERHIHPEIELSYCLKGEYSICMGSRELRLKEGDLVIVNPMAPHEFPKNATAGSRRLTIELGPGLLGEHFETFARMNPVSDVIRLKAPGPGDGLFRQLAELLEETTDLKYSPTEFSGLLIRGNLYRISATILQILAGEHSRRGPEKPFSDVEKIEQALEIVYNHYTEPLTLDGVSQACGYSKSNFCKIFKMVTGETFHGVLNRHRTEIACLHLKNSSDSIEKIALEVGFADAKSFCRVFRKMTGQTPGAYRRKLKAEQKA